MKNTLETLAFIFISCFFTNCSIFSYKKYRKALREEKMVQYYFRKEIPFFEDKGQIIVAAKINGQLQNFIFDTGAGTILDEKFYKSLNIKQLGKQKRMDAAGNKKMSQTGVLDKLTVGDIDFTSIIVNSTDLSSLQQNSCTKFAGILGRNVMNKAIWQIDYRKKIITICDHRDTIKHPTDSQAFAFLIKGQSTPIVRLSTENQYLGEAEIDTGNNGGIDFPKKTMEKLPKNTTFIKKIGSTNTLFKEIKDTTFTTLLPLITFEDKLKVKNELIRFSTNLTHPLIGNEFLKQFLVTIDWKWQEITFSSYQANDNQHLEYFGFSPKWKDGKVVVASIFDNSSASEANIELNDQIIQIDNTDFRNCTFDDYCHFLQKNIFKENKKISITIKKGNQETKHNLLKTNLLEK
jgi:predicted aspartyl protease